MYELDASGAIVAADTRAPEDQSYYTVDWQTRSPSTRRAADRRREEPVRQKDPPVALRSDGAHMLGFDYRYLARWDARRAKLSLSFWVRQTLDLFPRHPAGHEAGGHFC